MMIKTLLSRLAIAAALLALFGALAWRLPLDEPTTRQQEQAGTPWSLPALSPPRAPGRVKKLQERLGWAQTNSRGGRDSRATEQQADSLRILGISRQAGVEHLIVSHAGSLHALSAGEHLPDGRRLQAIDGLEIELASSTGVERVRLFPYARPGDAETQKNGQD